MITTLWSSSERYLLQVKPPSVVRKVHFWICKSCTHCLSQFACVIHRLLAWYCFSLLIDICSGVICSCIGIFAVWWKVNARSSHIGCPSFKAELILFIWFFQVISFLSFTRVWQICLLSCAGCFSCLDAFLLNLKGGEINSTRFVPIYVLLVIVCVSRNIWFRSLACWFNWKYIAFDI